MNGIECMNDCLCPREGIKNVHALNPVHDIIVWYFQSYIVFLLAAYLMPGSYLEFLFSSPVIFTLPSISVFLWAKIDNTALNVVFWCILNKMSFRYQKFKECLISKQLGYEVKLQIVTHISLHVIVNICI